MRGGRCLGEPSGYGNESEAKAQSDSMVVVIKQEVYDECDPGTTAAIRFDSKAQPTTLVEEYEEEERESCDQQQGTHISLQHVFTNFGEGWTFTDFFGYHWKLFASSYVDGWVSCVHDRKCIKVSYSWSEEKSLAALRMAVYQFLRALCYEPLTSNITESQKKKFEINSRKIQIPFVKLICYAAWQTRGNLKSTIHFERLIVLAYYENDQVYHSSCFLCPKLDGFSQTKDQNVCVENATKHMKYIHTQSVQLPYRTSTCVKNSELKLSLKEYLTKLQETVASLNRVLAVLDLKNKPYWFKLDERLQ